MAAMTKPLLSRMTTPMPDFFCSLKVAPSQFIFTISEFGGCHLARNEVRSGRVMEGAGSVSLNSATLSFADDRIWWTLMFGWLKRTWFLLVQINHTEVENSSKLWSFVMSHESNSLKSIKVCLLRHRRNGSSSHTTSSLLQVQKAWRADSMISFK